MAHPHISEVDHHRADFKGDHQAVFVEDLQDPGSDLALASDLDPGLKVGRRMEALVDLVDLDLGLACRRKEDLEDLDLSLVLAHQVQVCRCRCRCQPHSRPRSSSNRTRDLLPQLEGCPHLGKVWESR